MVSSAIQRFYGLIRPLLASLLAVGVLIQIVVMSPSWLERPEARSTPGALDRDTLLRIYSTGENLATDIPVDEVPDYTIKEFTYTSSDGLKREWKIDAERTDMYNSRDLVHSMVVTTYIFGEEEGEKPTIVVGKEAKYLSSGRNLEMFGDVVTRFPDGFTLYSDYMLYLPKEKKIVVPKDKGEVRGESGEGEENRIFFKGEGLISYFETGNVFVESKVHFTMTPSDAQKDGNGGLSDFTVIRSDRSKIERKTSYAYFSMYKSRPPEKRFVRIQQPDLYVRSRRAKLNYGDVNATPNYMVAYEDVFIRELENEDDVQYATGGQADFDTKRNIIVLTKFPQVYQGGDTVTGDMITMFRDEDIVEVERSNAFSEGSAEEPTEKEVEEIEIQIDGFDGI